MEKLAPSFHSVADRPCGTALQPKFRKLPQTFGLLRVLCRPPLSCEHEAPFVPNPAPLTLFAATFEICFEPMEGFEPPTSWLQISCSGQLSYIGIFVFPAGSKRPRLVYQVIFYRLWPEIRPTWECKCSDYFDMSKNLLQNSPTSYQ